MSLFVHCDAEGCEAVAMLKYVPSGEWTDEGEVLPKGWHRWTLSNYVAHACGDHCFDKLKSGNRSMTPTSESGHVKLPTWRRR